MQNNKSIIKINLLLIDLTFLFLLKPCPNGNCDNPEHTQAHHAVSFLRSSELFIFLQYVLLMPVIGIDMPLPAL